MDNRNTQNSLASDAPSEWEKYQQNQKKNLQKKTLSNSTEEIPVVDDCSGWRNCHCSVSVCIVFL